MSSDDLEASDPHGTPGALAMPDLLAFVLRRAAAVALHDFQAILAGNGIRPIQYAILALLRTAPGIRQSQLSPALGIRRTNLVPLLTELETGGLCERRPVPGDRRAAALFLTAAGETLRARCQVDAEAYEARLVARIGQAGRQHLLSLLHRLSDSAFDPPGATTPATVTPEPEPPEPEPPEPDPPGTDPTA